MHLYITKHLCTVIFATYNMYYVIAYNRNNKNNYNTYYVIVYNLNNKHIIRIMLLVYHNNKKNIVRFML